MALHIGVPGTWRAIYGLAKGGVVPAEVLPQTLRHRLFREAREDGLSISEIAALTMTTEYTVARVLRMEEPT